MKRCEPGDMDRTGPRVYVPVSLPDAEVPSYAVLEFLGFASPVVAHQPGSPAVLCLPASSVGSSASHTTLVPMAGNSVNPAAAGAFNSRSTPSFLPSRPLPVPPNFPITHHIGTDTLPKAPHGLHMVWPTGAPEVVQPESPPSPAAVSNGASFSIACKDSKEKKATARVSQVRKPGASGVMASSPIATPGKSQVGNSECSGPVAPRISVSQSEKETIVHIHSSNFRDVVRQLTGASSSDQDLLPVTLPARMVNRANSEGTGKHEANQKCETGVPTRSVAELGLRKAPLKLHERRKTMRNLEKLSTTMKEIPPLVPSPVTPLASDFEKFCTATTPTASHRSASVSPGSAVEEDCVILEERRHAVGIQPLPEQGYYALSPRPLRNGPTLLNLFPESPVCSPRD